MLFLLFLYHDIQGNQFCMHNLFLICMYNSNLIYTYGALDTCSRNTFVVLYNIFIPLMNTLIPLLTIILCILSNVIVILNIK